MGGHDGKVDTVHVAPGPYQDTIAGSPDSQQVRGLPKPRTTGLLVALNELDRAIKNFVLSTAESIYGRGDRNIWLKSDPL